MVGRNISGQCYLGNVDFFLSGGCRQLLYLTFCIYLVKESLFLRLFLRMQNGSYGRGGDFIVNYYLKPSFLHSFSRSSVNKRPLTDGWQTTCNATLSLTLQFIKTDDRPLYFTP